MAKKLTQVQLADLTEIDRSDISRIESGTRSVTATAIVRLSTALDVPVATLTELAASFERERAGLPAPVDPEGVVVVPPEVRQRQDLDETLTVKTFTLPSLSEDPSSGCDPDSSSA